MFLSTVKDRLRQEVKKQNIWKNTSANIFYENQRKCKGEYLDGTSGIYSFNRVLVVYLYIKDNIFDNITYH